jgi:hypothetical protein
MISKFDQKRLTIIAMTEKIEGMSVP